MFNIKPGGFFIALLLLSPRLSFSYQEPAQELETVVVTKQKQFLLNAYSTSSSQSESFNYQSAVEELTGLPVDLQSRSLQSGIQTDFSLRGSSFQQVLILLNGQRVNDPQTGHYNSDIPFTKEDIKRIEVIPGAGSSLFGPDAIGGAINFVLRPPEDRRVSWEFGAGNNRNGYGLFSFSDKIKDLGLRFSIEDAQSKGFRFDTDYKKFTTSLGAYLQLPDGVWENNFGYQEKAFGAFDFYTPGRGFPSFEWTNTYLINSGLTLNREGLLIKPNFLWRRHYDKFVLDKTQARSSSANNHRTDMFTPSIYLQKDIGRLGKAGLGMEWGQERIVSTNLGNHTRDHKSVFLDDSLALGQKWDLGFSFRWDNFSDFNEVYTGSASAKFKLTEKAAFNFGISRTMRIPSFTELFYSDPTTIGNPDLAAEKAWNYQAGFEYKEQDFSSGLVFFLRSERNMIDWVRTDPSQKWQARNFTHDDVFGVECSLSRRINSLLSIDANYAYTDKKIDTQGFLYKYGPNYARHLINTIFNIHLPFGRQEIGFQYKKRPGRRGWLLMNAGLNYDLNKNSRIFLNSTNILNVEYQDIAGIPQPGRYVEAGFRLEW
ncbi:MAG: TonB-dependent receptor [Candidatus Omnitrophica bacterium]|nr:TonB-dependent receptor [Candidatus Omnitrophota bacterium]